VIGRLALILLVVADLERSVAFYGDLLGLRVRYRSTSWMELDAGEMTLALHAAGADVGTGPTTGCTFAFYVNDVAAWVEELNRTGVAIVHEPHREEFGMVAVIADPDGYRIHLVEFDAVATEVTRGRAIGGRAEKRRRRARS